MEYSDADWFDVIVVGGGIMGSYTTYELAKRGCRVLLLEQFDFLHHRGSSHGESRTLRATYPEPYYSRLVMDSIPLWEAAESEVGYRVFFKTPQLDMGPSDNRSLISVIANCRSNSIPHRVLSPGEVRDQFSGSIDLPENWTGVLSDVGGVIRPTKAVSMFQTLALRRGAVLKDNTEVKDIVMAGGGGILVCSGKEERFWGRKCVVTAGAWTQKLVKKVTGAAVAPPVQPLETAVLYWKIKEGRENDFTIGGGFPTFASYGVPYVYGTPSLEFPGLIKIPVHGGRPCDPDERTWSVHCSLDFVKEWIRGRFNGAVDVDRGPVMTQSCLYSMTPDEDIIIDFLGGKFGKEVVVAGGFSGHGFKMAPAVGRVLADLVLSGEAKGVNLSHFRLGRFEDGNGKGNVKKFEEQVVFSSSTTPPQ